MIGLAAMVYYTLNVWSRGKQLVLFTRESCRTRGKTKLTSFPRDHTLSALLYILTFPSTIRAKQTNKQTTERATTEELYPGRDTFEFDQGHVTKNQQSQCSFC